jgi:hypothetical protein
VRGVQYTANQGQEWTRTRATTQRKDFHLVGKSFPDGEGQDFQAKWDCQKGVAGMHLYVYIVLIKDCV